MGSARGGTKLTTRYRRERDDYVEGWLESLAAIAEEVELVKSFPRCLTRYGSQNCAISPARCIVCKADLVVKPVSQWY